MDTSPFPRSQAGYSPSWAAHLIQRLDDLLAFLRGDFVPIGRLVSQNGRINGITFVTTTPYNAQPDDHIILVNVSGAATVNLLEDPDLGMKQEIIDASGAAGSNNITIARTGSGLINGAASSLTISANYGGYRAIYDKTTWIAHAL